MKKPFSLLKLLVLGGLFCLGNTASAQLTSGGNTFLKGNFVEIGIAPNGAFGSTIDAPSGGGYHARPTPVQTTGIYDPFTGTLQQRFSALGFVADPEKNGWNVGNPAYYGDYFMPGTPQEGFSIEANGQVSNAWTFYYYGISGATGFQGASISGTNVSYSAAAGRKSTEWHGSMLNGALGIRQTTALEDTNVYFTVSISLKNNSTAAINNVYYMRTVDADNDISLPSGSYSTNNQIVNQLPNLNDKVLVCAKGLNYPNAYLGLGTKDCRAKVYMLSSGISPTGGNPSAYYNGTATDAIYSGSLINDVGMGLVLRIGTIAPGDSTSFSFAYILKEPDLDSAVKLTQPTFTYNGNFYNSGDTVNVCQNVGAAHVNIVNGGFYNWTWTPSTGLSTTTGTSNTITLGSAPQTYVINGASSQPALCPSSRQLKITIKPFPVPADPVVTNSILYCVGASSSALLPNGAGYRWYTSATGGTSVASITPSTVAAGVTTYYVVATNGVCESNRIPVTVTISAGPIITNQPVNTSVCDGSIASISISATSGVASYKWQHDQGSGFVDLPNAAPYSGVNSSTLSIAGVTPAFNNRLYRCIVTGICTPNASSNPATLKVIHAPLITSQPQNDTICLGLSGSLSVTATGAALIYQWQHFDGLFYTNLSNNANYSGVNTATLNINNAVLSQKGLYRCVVSGTCPPTAITNPAEVTITDISTIWSQPNSFTLCEGVPKKLEILTTGPILSYKWQRLNFGISPYVWVDINDDATFYGSNTNLLEISAVTNSFKFDKFRCNIVGACISPVSNEILIDLYDAPSITQEPASLHVRSGDGALFTVTTNIIASGLKFHWQASLDGINFVNINDNAIYTGTHTLSLSVPNVTLAVNNRVFRCIIEDGGSCGYPSLTTVPVTLTVHDPLSIVTNNKAGNNISIYPNPISSDQLFIKINDNTEQLAVQVLNTLGAVVLNETIHFNNQNIASINVSSLPAAVYTLKTVDAKTGNVQNLKFTKQ